MMNLKYMVVIEKSESGFGAYVPDLPGCIAVGDTEDEVKGLIKEAIAFHIEGLTTGTKLSDTAPAGT